MTQKVKAHKLTIIILAGFFQTSYNKQPDLESRKKTGMCIVVLCTMLISRIYTGDKAKIEAASSNKEAKRVEERVAEEVTITT